MKKNIVQIRNLTKIFETKENTVTALEDINLDIEEGNFVSIIGGSGCGNRNGRGYDKRGIKKQLLTRSGQGAAFLL